MEFFAETRHAVFDSVAVVGAEAAAVVVAAGFVAALAAKEFAEIAQLKSTNLQSRSNEVDPQKMKN